MHALHSSSVLACNVFDYWRSAGLALIAQALRIEPLDLDRLTFEEQFPTGLPGNPPNLDVALWLRSGAVWGIESKFTEPYGSPKHVLAFKDKYFPAGRPIWNGNGLPHSGSLAAALQDGAKSFQRLDAQQLLKHALGLQIRHPGQFTLCYIYVDHDAPEAERHKREIAEFGDSVQRDFPFVALSYTTFLKRLHSLAGGNHEAYFSYMDKRYGFLSV